MSKIKKAKKTTSSFWIAFINLMQLLFPKTILLGRIEIALYVTNIIW